VNLDSTARPVLIRPAEPADHEAIWAIFHEVVSREDSFVFDPTTSRQEALAYWLQPGAHTFVAIDESGGVIGSYIVKANQPGLGSHVANASFMVSPSFSGKGAGRLMGSHCLREARRNGFRAMQFNFVVSTNVAALALWQSLGFAIVGTLPQVFKHRDLGYVDAHVMYRSLENIE
jgi:L-amino acid N-acyltransferase YncA